MSIKKGCLTGIGLFLFYAPIIAFAIGVILLHSVFDLPENSTPCNGFEPRYYPCNLCCLLKDSCEEEDTRPWQDRADQTLWTIVVFAGLIPFLYLLVVILNIDRREKAIKCILKLALLTFYAFIALSMSALIISTNTQGGICRGHYLVHGSFEMGTLNYADTENLNLFTLAPVADSDGEAIEGYAKTKGTFLLYFGFYFAIMGYSTIAYMFASCCRSFSKLSAITGRGQINNVKRDKCGR